MSNMPPPLPPQQPQYMTPPPPQPPPKRGLSGCAIAAIVVGVIVALVAIGIGVSGYVFMNKVGGKAGIVRSAFGMANPDYDILDVDNKNQTITVRHKKTGKQATIAISALKNGRIDPADLGMTAEQAEGTGGAPEWVKYPGAKLATSATVLSITTLVYQTDDPPDKVLEYYKTQSGNQGITAINEHNGALVIKDAKGDLNIAVAENIGLKQTQITVVYRAK